MIHIISNLAESHRVKDLNNLPKWIDNSKIKMTAVVPSEAFVIPTLTYLQVWTLLAGIVLVISSIQNLTLSLPLSSDGSAASQNHSNALTQNPEWVFEPILPLCLRIDKPTWTCAHIFSKKPSLLTECLANPSASQCNLNCQDVRYLYHPQGSMGIIRSDSGNQTEHQKRQQSVLDQPPKNLWPPLARGDWFRDEGYCQSVQNTTGHCLYDIYRYVVLDEPSSNHFHTKASDASNNASLLRGSPVPQWTASNACRLLHQRNISEIHFVGDSLVRNSEQGMATVLNGDLDFVFSQRKKECYGEYAFYGYECRSIKTSPGGFCNGSVSLSFSGTNPRSSSHIPAFPLPLVNKNVTGKQLIIYGVGNHPANRDRKGKMDRGGILNSQRYKKTKWSAFINQSYFWAPPSEDEDKDAYLIWMPPHYKIRIGRTDETNQRSWNFGLETHDWFQSLGSLGTVNTYDLTYSVSKFVSSNGEDYFSRLTCNRTTLTADGYHYNRLINVWKGHMILSFFDQAMRNRPISAGAGQ